MIGIIPVIKNDFVPVGNKNRSGLSMKATSITMHNTANPKSTPENERAWLTNLSNTRLASWHLCVGQYGVIGAIPLNEVAWHAGDGSGDGNMKSIGIEMCESGDQTIVWKNTVGLVASMLHERGWGVDRIKKHQDWSGKYCPRLLIPRWDEFIRDVQDTLNFLIKPPVPVWMTEGIKYLYDNKLLNEYDGWAKKAEENMPVWSMMTLVANLYGKLSGKTFPATADWKSDGINALATAGLLSDPAGWIAKIDKEIPVWSATTVMANVIDSFLPTKKIPTSNWKIDGITYMASSGMLSSPEDWIKKIDQTIPVWAVCTMLANIHKKLGR